MNRKRPHELRREESPGRFCVDPAPDWIPGLLYFGRQQYVAARPPLRRHAHRGAVEICFLGGGEQVFSVGGDAYRMKGGDIFITFPGERHGSGGRPMEKAELYWMGIDVEQTAGAVFDMEEGESRELRARLVSMRRRRHFRGVARMKGMFDALIHAYEGERPLRRVVVRSRVLDFLFSVLACFEKRHSPGPSPSIREVMHYIDGHLEQPLGIRELARQAGLSPPRFKARFREEAGIPPREYVLRRKIEAAKAMLRTSGTSVTHTALDLGFSSSQYFATVFKRFTSTTPREFRSSRDR